MEKGNINKRVATWLHRVLTERYKSMKVQTIESGNTRLSRLIADLGLKNLFPEFNAWDVKVDVTGILQGKQEAYLALIDFEPKKLTIDDVAVLLGYARAVNPILCMLISPYPPVDPLITLLKDYGRHDVLEYGREKRHIRIAKWHDVRKEVIPGSIFPPGRLF